MNLYPLEELAAVRMEQLRREARTDALARRRGAHRSLADAVCRWRTRVGGTLVNLGRLIAPANERAGIPVHRNSC